MIISKMAPVLAFTFILCSVGSANAKTYCAHYIGGPERLAAYSRRGRNVVRA
jgi:hypothetical protein